MIVILIFSLLFFTERENSITDGDNFAPEGKIALLIVSDEKDSSNVMSDLAAKKLDNNNIGPITALDNLKDAQDSYPYLKIKRMPKYVVFNSEKPIYETDDYEDLLNYLVKYDFN